MSTMGLARNVGLIFCLLLTTKAAMGRDHVLAVGSSTIFPFATATAERVGQSTRFKTPQVEPWGSGGGIRMFCKGVGTEEADMVFASRKITPTELEKCAQNGISDLLELRLGWDGIILATVISGPYLTLTLQEIYLALAQQVPSPKGTGDLVPNPYKRWSEINGSLPDIPIHVYGPPTTSGTRDVLVEQALQVGCREYPWLNVLERSDPRMFRQGCGIIREDEGYISSGEDDNLIVRKVSQSDQAVGIFGFSYYDQNRDKLQASKIDGVEPTFDTISNRSYPLARPLYLYIKGPHLSFIPGLQQFVREIVSARASGEDGYLIDMGLIPNPEAEREANAQKVEERLTEHQ